MHSNFFRLNYKYYNLSVPFVKSILVMTLFFIINPVSSPASNDCDATSIVDNPCDFMLTKIECLQENTYRVCFEAVNQPGSHEFIIYDDPTIISLLKDLLSESSNGVILLDENLSNMKVVEKLIFDLKNF